MGKYYTDYPRQSINPNNPYDACAYCGKSDPAVNGQLENHLESCEYRQLKKLELQLELANLEIECLKIDFEKAYSQGCTDTLSFLYGEDSQEKPKT